jgi:glycosyltransferase involved in cell wall biosynthesis
MERLGFEGGAGHNAVELGIHVARYSVVAELCRGRRVLDVACGQGFGSHLMVTRWGAASVHAVDVSAAALAQARALFDRPEITWLEMDADHLDAAALGEPFDLIVSFETIEHLHNPAAVLRSLKALVKPGGTIVVSCPNDHWYYGPGRSKNVWHRHTYTFEEFRTLAEGILGPATSYLVGSTAGGFANTPLADGGAPRTLVEGLERVERGAAVEVPSEAARAPSPEASLYWIGVWGPATLAPSVTYTPLSPDHYFAVDNLVPVFTFQQRVRPRIVLVADVRGWAFDNIAQHIRTHLGDAFEVFVIYFGEYPDWIACLREIVMDLAPDLVHFFWREYLFDILASDFGRAVCERYFLPEQAFLDRFSRMVVTTSVYDHLYADEESLRARTPYLWLVDGYSVSSERLHAIYGTGGPPLPDAVIEDGVDIELFRPAPRSNEPDAERELVVGWAGNSRWNRTETHDPKGLDTLLKPALERLREEGVRVTGRFMDSAERTVPRSEMPAFYNAVDVYVCVSEIEGTPNPVLEAMACGVPIVSTDVGIVPQVFGPEQRRFILPERTIDALVAALRELLADAGLRRRLADENLVRIRSWSWAHQMPKWLQLFKIAAGRVDLRMLQRRRSTLAFAATGIARLEEVLRQKEAVIKATEELALKRYDIMEHLGREIGARDEVIREERARVARLEGDLAYARSPRGMLRRVLDVLRTRARRLVPGRRAEGSADASHRVP